MILPAVCPRLYCLLPIVLLALFFHPADASAADTDVVINEVSYLDGANQDWVELKNTGATTIDVSAWWLCSRFSYAQLSGLATLDGTDLTLSPGEIATVEMSFDLNNTSAPLSFNPFPSNSSKIKREQIGKLTHRLRKQARA